MCQSYGEHYLFNSIAFLNQCFSNSLKGLEDLCTKNTPFVGLVKPQNCLDLRRKRLLM